MKELERLIVELRSELELLDRAIQHLERLAERHRASVGATRPQPADKPRKAGGAPHP